MLKPLIESHEGNRIETLTGEKVDQNRIVQISALHHITFSQKQSNQYGILREVFEHPFPFPQGWKETTHIIISRYHSNGEVPELKEAYVRYAVLRN